MRVLGTVTVEYDIVDTVQNKKCGYKTAVYQGKRKDRTHRGDS
ncbi:MAG: hypothetical protein WKG06_42345 [Segetibacter sp.]